MPSEDGGLLIEAPACLRSSVEIPGRGCPRYRRAPLENASTRGVIVKIACTAVANAPKRDKGSIVPSR